MPVDVTAAEPASAAATAIGGSAPAAVAAGADPFPNSIFDTSTDAATGADDSKEAGGEPSAPKPRKMVSTQWTAEMDAQLTAAVTQFGEGQWSKIAELVTGRTGKQCRERWKNQISAEVKKGDWTPEEDKLIVDSVAELGTRWSEISKRFVGRTDNAIKNRYNSEVRKRERSEQRAIREAAAAEERAKNPEAAAAAAAAAEAKSRKRKSSGAGERSRSKKQATDDAIDELVWLESDEAVSKLESNEIDALLAELSQPTPGRKRKKSKVSKEGKGGKGGKEGKEGEAGPEGEAEAMEGEADGMDVEAEAMEGEADGTDDAMDDNDAGSSHSSSEADGERFSLHQVLQTLRRARSPKALLKAAGDLCKMEEFRLEEEHKKSGGGNRTPSSHPNAPAPLRTPGSHSQLAQLLHDDEHELLPSLEMLLHDAESSTYDFTLLLSPEARSAVHVGASAHGARLPSPSRSPTRPSSVGERRTRPASATGAERPRPASADAERSRPASAGDKRARLGGLLSACARSSLISEPSSARLDTPEVNQSTSPLLASLLASPPRCSPPQQRFSPRLAAEPGAEGAAGTSPGSGGEYHLKRLEAARPIGVAGGQAGGGEAADGAPATGDGAGCSRPEQAVRLAELPFFDLAGLLTPLIAHSLGASPASVRNLLRLDDGSLARAAASAAAASRPAAASSAAASTAPCWAPAEHPARVIDTAGSTGSADGSIDGSIDGSADSSADGSATTCPVESVDSMDVSSDAISDGNSGSSAASIDNETSPQPKLSPEPEGGSSPTQAP